MAAHEHLSGLQFDHRDDGRYTRITAKKDGRERGHMIVTNSTGEIAHVESEVHRQGVATALYQHAQASGIDVGHSVFRTDAGDAWAKKVGGYLPPRDED